MGSTVPLSPADYGHGIRHKPIAPGSPWRSGFAERLIGSIRCECVDHIVAVGEGQLRRVLQSYARYYNGSRTHRALNKDAPHHRQSRASIPSSHDQSSTGFTTDIAESSFRYTQVYLPGVSYGWTGFLLLSGVLAVATLAGMVTFTWLSLAGLERLETRRAGAIRERRTWRPAGASGDLRGSP